MRRGFEWGADWPGVVLFTLIVVAFAGLGIGAKCEADKPIDPRPVTTQYGRALDALSVVCLDGVEYWWVEDASVRYRATAIAPRYTRDGKLKLCEVEVPR